MSRAEEILADLRRRRNPDNVAGQRRYGITPKSEQLGVPVPHLREIAKRHRRDHALAQELWATGVHEARLTAAFMDDPRQVTRSQAETWTRQADSWALVDSASMLFCRAEFAAEKARTWSGRKAEFVKRSGFSLMAMMAVHRKELPDDVFLEFLSLIRREANDERNVVKKAVNWALRQIGKRNPRLRRAAIAEAVRIRKLNSPTARWIATDALRELRS
ncbi:MAG TPA: DNA alkylation repair protein [Opitutaceae bacterium]|nr:DNA alkylation repair protein [Opitutaceae bacterium]HND60556.1 DNA alkylation repair protein [Opitutaceae bacterium]